MIGLSSWCWAVLAGLALCAVTQRAAASESYPEDVRRKLELEQVPGPAPGCRLCHTDDEGGLKNVTRPFGRRLMQAGASGANLPSLLSAIEALEADGSDSDGDGTGDIAELRAGSDPNVGEDGSEPLSQVPLPRTGCGVASPARAPWTALGLLSSIVGALALVRRQRSLRAAAP